MAAPSTSKKELLSILPPQILASPRVVTAMAIAEDAHGEQLRDTGETYLEGHIWLLAMQVYEHYTSAGNFEQLLIASLLHDVVEDSSNYSIEIIDQKFGKEMADIITALTKKPEEDSAKTQAGKFQENKRYLARLATHGEIAIRLKLEDRIANLRSIVADANLVRIDKYKRQTKEAQELFMPLAKSLSGQPDYRWLIQNEVTRIKNFLD